MTAASSNNTPPQNVSPTEAREWIKAGHAVLIDVREPEEFQREHISGAVLHPASSFDSMAVEQIAGGKPIIFQCASGMRAMKVCEKFITETKAAENMVYLLKGSLMGWKAAGLPVESK